jgi:enamine deaminase RidA (YjgF/YER057c/UK114 family)
MSNDDANAPVTSLQSIDVPGWPRPRGYANGVVLPAGARTLLTGGQIGWEPDGTFTTDDFAEQFAKALDNVLAVVRAAGGAPEHVARMTVYVTDLDEYRASLASIGAAWKTRLGRHYPAMALVRVAGLLEPRAKVEIEATAMLPVST